MTAGITSWGYPGVFAPGEVWAELQYAVGNRYYVEAPSAAICTPLQAGTRQVQISAGRLGGWGVADKIVDPQVVQLPAVTTVGQTRWFLIVARRTWGSTNETAIVALDPGWTTPPTTLPAVGTADTTWNRKPGTRDDQPLWIVPLSQGQTVPGAPIDVRLIGNGSDFLAQNDMVRQYADWAGIQIRIGTMTWRRLLNTSGTGLVWDADPGPFGFVSGLTKYSGLTMFTDLQPGWSFTQSDRATPLENFAWKYGNFVGISIAYRRTGTKVLPSSQGDFNDSQTSPGRLIEALRPLTARYMHALYRGRDDTATDSLAVIGGGGYISRTGAISLYAGRGAPFGVNQNTGDLPSITMTDTYLFAE